ncbi:hypothetical protein CYMTET_5276 [Cymbomonas tetramitiformis]|uniref:Uncharacterized protein n=1 Tax=Cymbomonas tetramitiformis TaxID=36881 RepID=A0AAE0GZS6_9CHLO|nr:hypothetical protein CYMTET_5276 [Cymbomonas tetramitiformis]
MFPKLLLFVFALLSIAHQGLSQSYSFLRGPPEAPMEMSSKSRSLERQALEKSYQTGKMPFEQYREKNIRTHYNFASPPPPASSSTPQLRSATSTTQTLYLQTRAPTEEILEYSRPIHMEKMVQVTPGRSSPHSQLRNFG